MRSLRLRLIQVVEVDHGKGIETSKDDIKDLKDLKRCSLDNEIVIDENTQTVRHQTVDLRQKGSLLGELESRTTVKQRAGKMFIMSLDPWH